MVSVTAFQPPDVRADIFLGHDIMHSYIWDAHRECIEWHRHRLSYMYTWKPQRFIVQAGTLARWPGEISRVTARAVTLVSSFTLDSPLECHSVGKKLNVLIQTSGLVALVVATFNVRGRLSLHQSRGQAGKSAR